MIASPEEKSPLPPVGTVVALVAEHGVIGFAFLAAGDWILQAYNSSIIGMLGLLMMLWGGLFKGIVVLGLLGLTAYAALFRRDWFASEARRRHIARVAVRVDRDLTMGAELRAEDRLRGLLSVYPGDMAIRRRLGALLMEREAQVAAGQVLALHPAPTRTELQAIGAFCNAQGHDPFQILRKAIKGVGLTDLPAGSLSKLSDLHAAVFRQEDRNAWQTGYAWTILQVNAPAPLSRRLWDRFGAALGQLTVLGLLVGLLAIAA